MSVELTQAEYEVIEVKAEVTRRAFLDELSKHRELSRLYAKLKALEHAGIDARRARREAEVLEGAES